MSDSSPLSDEDLAALLEEAGRRVRGGRALTPLEQATSDLFHRYPWRMRRLTRDLNWYRKRLLKAGIDLDDH